MVQIMNPLEKWECGECGGLHDDEDDARECCQPRIAEVWQCPICEEPYRAESAAIQCIADCEEAGGERVYMASKAELESQGQERLF